MGENLLKWRLTFKWLQSISAGTLVFTDGYLARVTDPLNLVPSEATFFIQIFAQILIFAHTEKIYSYFHLIIYFADDG